MGECKPGKLTAEIKAIREDSFAPIIDTGLGIAVMGLENQYSKLRQQLFDAGMRIEELEALHLAAVVMSDGYKSSSEGWKKTSDAYERTAIAFRAERDRFAAAQRNRLVNLLKAMLECGSCANGMCFDHHTALVKEIEEDAKE